MAHYENTAEEILYALDDKVDMVVVGAGTGGSVTGIARKIKEVCPDCKVKAFHRLIWYTTSSLVLSITFKNLLKQLLSIH